MQKRMAVKPILEEALRQGFALTFDDVRLKTGYSEVLPDEVDVGTLFSRNVTLKIPLVSAAMNTVTESELAIELAKLGGLGVIHRSLTPEVQAREVARVKKHLHGLIEEPTCVYGSDTIGDILQRRDEGGYTFHRFPVIDEQRTLVGILTGSDFEFCDDQSKLASDMMTSEDLLTAGPDTTIGEAYDLMRGAKRKNLPLVNERGQVVGLYVFSDVQRVMTGDAAMYTVDSRNRLRVAAAIGTGDKELSRLELLVSAGVDVIVIDTAHGDSRLVVETLREATRQYETVDVVAGNVSVGESAQRLVDAGADGVKIGQGPGSICTTRVVAGIGRPQLTAIYDCARSGNIPLCADGGIRNSGDITIAIAAGANSVMLGSMFAGTAEAPGEVVFVEGRQWKSYRGMGSLGAMEESAAARARYLQSGSAPADFVPEGVEGIVPFKGPLSKVVVQYVGGLRKGMGYVGATTIHELQEKGDFDRLTGAGLRESHPSVKMIRDAPTYGGRGE